MNKRVLLCRAIAAHPASSQRELAKVLDVSVGNVHGLIKEATQSGCIRYENSRYVLTDVGFEWLNQFKVDNAIILAAGFGSRFVPFTYETPKGLLKVKGVPMIERQIEQLLAAGVTEIIVVVGYLAEMFEYLVDVYGVTLVYNPEYASKNNYTSLYYAREHLANSYILVADDWIEESIFNSYEPDSWVSCIYNEGKTEEWCVTVGPHDVITRMEIGGADDWVMVGPAFFTHEYSAKYVPFLERYYEQPGTENFYWENIIRKNIKELPIYINRQSAKNVYEFECVDDLCAYDPNCLDNLDSSTFKVISRVFGVPQAEIVGARPMVEGMTNQSFVFEVAGNRYVYRRPGAGTDRLINRNNEKRSYELMAPFEITDEIIYFDGGSGIKITKHYNARVGNPYNDDEVKVMMEVLRKIHEANIQVDYRFDVEERIGFYEALANERNSILFEDYPKVRMWAEELFAFRRSLAVPERLCHIDYIFANVLFLPDNSGIRVIDWEYAGMADPIIDVAMFSLYTYYTKEQMDRALYHYLGHKPTRQEEARLYLYVALAGLTWSIWTEYKQGLGDDFGDYALVMYRYLKDYYKLLKESGYLDEL